MALFVVSGRVQSEDATAITPVDPQLGRPVDFYMDLFPILESKCMACHNVKTKEGDLVLEGVDAILKGGSSGPAVVAGKPDESYLFTLASRSDEPAMPPLPNKAQAKPLTPRELGIVRQWILEGAKKGNPPPASSINWAPVPAHVHSVYAIALEPQGRFVAAGRANRVVLFDLANKSEAAQLTDPALLAVMKDGQPMYGQGIAHQDFVHSLAFSPDGNLLASGGFRVVKLWERIREQTQHQLTAAQAVHAVAIAADGTIAATAYADGTVQLWNLTTGQAASLLKGHTAAVSGIAFSPDAQTVLTASDDKTLRRWKTEDGSSTGQIDVASEPKAVMFSKDGTQWVSGHQDNILRLWNVTQFDPPAVEAAATDAAEAKPAEAPKPVKEMPGHGQPIVQLMLVPESDEFLSSSKDGQVKIWNISNGNQVRTLTLGSPVAGMSITPDGTRIAACGENGIARIWRRDNGTQLAEIKGDPQLDRQILALAEEQTVATLKVQNADAAVKEGEKDITGREESVKKSKEAREAAVKAKDEAEKKHKEAQDAARKATEELAAKPEDAGLKKKKEDADKAAMTAEDAFTKSQEAIVSADRAIKLSEEALERSKKNLTEFKQTHEQAVAKQKSGEEELKQAKDKTAAAVTPLAGISFSPDGSQLATAGTAGRIDLWNGETGTSLDTIAVGQPISQLSFTSNGSLLSIADKGITLRDVKPTWKLIGRLGPPEGSPLDVSQSPLVDRVLAITFSPDGKQLATGGGDPSRSGELLLWDVASRQVAKEFKEAHSDTVFDVAFSRDGQTLVSGAADKFVKRFDIATGNLIRAYEGHTSHVLSVSIKCDDSSIVSAGADNAIKLWNTSTGEQRRTMTNYSKQVTSIEYIGATDNFISCGGDNTVRLFTATNGNNFRSFSGATDFMYAAASSNDQKIVVAGGEDGIIRVWNGENGQEIAKFEPPKPAETTTAAK
ncbi:MAG: c-type cytochrome domain-containing protein [Planctomycetaceae bacterium]